MKTRIRSIGKKCKEANIMKTLKVLFFCFLILGIVSLMSIAQAEQKIWTVGHGAGYDFDEDASWPPSPEANGKAIQAAINAASHGDKIIVVEGNYFGANVNKQVDIEGSGADTVITSGVLHPILGVRYGYKVGFNILNLNQPDILNQPGATISNFKINCNVSVLFIIGVLIVNSNNTTVSHLLIQNPAEAINLFRSSQCEITHNTITGQIIGAGAVNLLNGGVSVNWRGPVKENLVAFNKIENSAGAGIYLNAPFNFPITLNTIKNNKINNPAVPGGKGIGLSANPLYLSSLEANSITFNDFRGCYDEIWYSDASLLTRNTFSRNLGYQSPDEPNRGQPPVDDLEYLNLPTQ